MGQSMLISKGINEKITAVTDNLYMDWKIGDITKADYLRMKAKFEQKVNEVA